MKKYLVLVLFTLATNLAFTHSIYQDVVSMRNMGTTQGILAGQNLNKSINIESNCRNVLVHPIYEIEKLIKEPVKNENSISNNSKVYESGYKGIVEMGYQYGVGAYRLNALKVNIINGYQINPYFSLGIGTGVRYYFDEEAALIPIFADFRANLIDNKISPYLSLGLGYSFNATNEFKGFGFLVNPTLGVSFKVSDKAALNFGVGYDLQKLKFYEYEDNSLDAISINIGISF
jgi:hypothetical protein